MENENRKENNMEIEGKKKYGIGYVPGVYDLFHIGHLNLIRRAKEKSEYLIAGVLSDELVMHFKGRKPYIPLKERMEIVGAVRYVDKVVEVNFENTVKMDAWKLYHYDAYFSGDDHGEEWNEEKRALQEVGSDLVFFPYTKETSSTKIKKQLKEEKIPRKYLFGAGNRGLQKLEEIREGEREGKWKIAGFLDNAPEKHLTQIAGIPVYFPSDLKTLEKEDDYEVIITMKEQEAAEKQLKELGIRYGLG